MVLTFLCFVFALVQRKNKTQKKTYRCKISIAAKETSMGLYTSRHPIARLELVSRPFMAFVRFYCRLRVEGLEHIPQSGAFILAVNHSSHADTAVIFAALARPMRKR